MKKIIILIISCLMSISIYKADCSDAKNGAENLFLYLKPAQLSSDSTYIYVLIPDDSFYLKVINTYDNLEKIYTRSDADENGFVVIESPDIFENINYNINVFYTDTTCGIESIDSFEFETGIYNKYSSSSVCNEMQVDVCNINYTPEMIKKYYEDEKLSDSNIKDIIQKELKEKNSYSFVDYVKKYYLYILVPLLIISVIYIPIIIFTRRKKKNETI